MKRQTDAWLKAVLESAKIIGYGCLDDLITDLKAADRAEEVLN